MPRRRLAILSGLALLACAVAAALAYAAGGSRSAASSFDDSFSELDPASARAFGDFVLYSLGATFEGLPLTRIRRREDRTSAPGDGGFGANYVSFLYGACLPSGGAGCPYPFEVQVWPACRRTLSDYRATPFSAELLRHERLEVRGVPAALFREAPGLARLELYTGRVTVVVFGSDDRAQLLRAAAALRAVNVAVSTDGALPAPVPGAVDGLLAC